MNKIQWIILILTVPMTLVQGQDDKNKKQADSLAVEKAVEEALDAPHKGSFSPYAQEEDEWAAFREGWALARKGMSEASRDFMHAMGEVDWEAMGEESRDAMERAARSVEEIDWDALRKDLEDAGMTLDSLIRELDARLEEE